VTGRRQPVNLSTAGPRGDPELLFVHASGFCKELWQPIAQRLEARFPGIVWRSIDIRGHGDSPKGEPPYEWNLLASDVAYTVGDTSPMLGVGHSIGGALVARAALERPELFYGLLLIEPIILPPPHVRLELALADLTERRRAVFPNRQAAYDGFADRAFRTWDAEVLAAYVDHGFDDTPHGWALKCLPSVEADMYREGGNHDTWDHLSELAVPVMIVAGDESDTHHEPYLGTLAAQFVDARVIVVEGASHFVPMEKPHDMVDLISVALENR